VFARALEGTREGAPLILAASNDEVLPDCFFFLDIKRRFTSADFMLRQKRLSVKRIMDFSWFA
jgi:hypothetical protein